MGDPESATTSAENVERLRDNLRKQLDEIEMLESIFPSEFTSEEGSGREVLRNYLEGMAVAPPPFVDFTINVTGGPEETNKAKQHKFELCVTLSQDYPTAPPDIYVRNSDLTRGQASAINKACSAFLATLESGDPCIYGVVLWLQEAVPHFITTASDSKQPESETDSATEQLVRYWIHSHHIYNKGKRREIQCLAGRLNITGFCMPGKPGVICAEGRASDCAQWWASVRGMAWQKIACKATENAAHRRFRTFAEVAFQAQGARGTHSDLGQLYKFLERHQLAFIFKELFGLDGGK